MDSSPVTVLHVDPDEATRDSVSGEVATESDMTLYGVDTIGEAMQRSDTTDIDCVVAEYELSDGTAFELFEQVRATHPDAACILYTESGFEDIDTTGTDDTVVEFLSKRIPGTEERITGLIRDVVADRMQVGYPVPDNEDERMEALAEYDQAYAEELLGELASATSFDRITELVKSRFDADVAFIGVIHAHEERMVACQGAQWSMLDRENTICTYSMLEDDVMVIPDVDEDPRFKHNDRLKELGIRSYAGANLTTPDGHVIGQLCVTDSEPKTYDFEDRHDLKLFADEVMEQFELRRRLPPEEATFSVGDNA